MDTLTSKTGEWCRQDGLRLERRREMSSGQHIVKRAGHTQPYDEKKLHISVYAAALAAGEPIVTAKLLAEEAVASVNKWLKNKHEVTSNDIRHRAARALEKESPETAHLYRTHRVVW